MLFEIDKQTFDDLAIFRSEHKNNSIINYLNSNSIFNLFNKTTTIGGKEKLEQIFNTPLTNSQEISERIAIINYFQTVEVELEVDKQECDFIEFYLSQHPKSGPFFRVISLLERIVYSSSNDNNDYIIRQGTTFVLKVLNGLGEFIAANDFDKIPDGLKKIHSAIREILEEEDFVIVKQLTIKRKLNTYNIAQADYLFRHSQPDKIKALLDIVYQLDVFRSVASAGKNMGFCLPVINETSGPVLTAKGLFHPLINNPIHNDVGFNYNKNLCFVTGTNMAGKSTFLKAIGICVYLSQLGFPVPAEFMETSTFKGLITTINLSDDILSGHSHFYSEVLRVKHVAQKINETQDIFVIFDELFRGTNVKDAYDASLAIISAFLKVRKSFFIISTHIIEVAKVLANMENINFRYMETMFDNDTPRHSYMLKYGISEERLGMWIVKNEKIVEIIEKAVN